MTFGVRLRRLLEERDMKQIDLARHFGLGKATVSHYISGEREPDMETLKKFAGFLGVSIDYLLGNSEVRLPPPDPGLSSRWPNLSPDRRQRAYEVERAFRTLTGAERVFAKGTTNEAFDAMAESLESFLQLLLKLNEKPDHS